MLDEAEEFQQETEGVVALTPRGSKEMMSYSCINTEPPEREGSGGVRKEGGSRGFSQQQTGNMAQDA